jgi:trafficking protein particle complex subunit 12
MAICLLYLGKLKDAIKLFEDCLNQNPISSLHESILLNICTLYELESTVCLEQKISILKLLTNYKGDGINMACLKLQV